MGNIRDLFQSGVPRTPLTWTCISDRKAIHHKVLTYRVKSCVWRLPTNDPPPPLHLASVSSPRIKGREVHTRRAVGGWGVNISEDARHWIGLLQCNPSTLFTLSFYISLQTFLCLLYMMLLAYPHSFVLQINSVFCVCLQLL
jgi:hypothetical protein